MPQDRTLKAIKSRSRSEQVSVVSLLLLPLWRGADGIWAAMPVSKLLMFGVVLLLWRRSAQEAAEEKPGFRLETEERAFAFEARR